MISPLNRSTFVSVALVALLWPALASAAERSWGESHPLDAGGSVGLENINGDVVIEAWDRDEVDIQATITSDSQEAVDEVTIEVSADRGSIDISTVYPERKGRTQRSEAASVDYRIKIPRGAGVADIELVNGSLTLENLGGRIDAEVVNGDLRARGLTGNAELATVNGSIDVRFDRLGADQRVSVESVNGSIDVHLPATADATLEAETVHGAIESDFELERDDERYVGQEARGKLGAGGGRLELENVNGSITIHRG